MNKDLKIPENTVIHCPTEELANKVLVILDKLGQTWSEKKSLLNDNKYNSYGESTCYNPNYLDSDWVCYADCGFYKDHGYKIIEATEFIKLHMKTRNVELTLEKAQEWYKKGGDLKEVALQAFAEEELEGINFKCITEMMHVIKALDISIKEYVDTLEILKSQSKASAAIYKLNLIKKALNMGQKRNFTEGEIWYPNNPAILSRNLYCRASYEEEVAKIRIGCDTFTLLGGRAYVSSVSGLGSFYSKSGVAYSYAYSGFLGCATKEIAQHMGKHFAKEIFEAKYGDTINYEWI